MVGHEGVLLPRPEEIQALISKSVESRLPQAIHDATGELIERLVEAQIHHHLMPVLGPSGMPGIMEKAEGARSAAQLSQRVADPKGLLFDPFSALDQMGFREKPTAITFNTLREMANRVPPYVAILFTRLNQMAALAEPQADEHSLGYKIVLADKRAKMTPELEARADWITRWVKACGDPKLKVKRDKFGTWMRKSVADSLIFDQLTTEIIPFTRSGAPAYIRAIDASTIRIADTLDELDLVDDSIQWVQVYENTVIAEFTDEEMIFGVRNPRSDIRYAGYGTSELERLIVIVTALLWGIDYNAKFFSQGSVAKGMINFKGAVPEKELINFRRQWYSMLSGVQNAWRTPIVNAEDVQWLNMHTSNRDMEFANWIDWLLKVVCGVCQIAPEEIGFQFGNGGQSSTMNEGNQEHKLKYSRDKGLVPLAKFVAEQLNEKVISRLDDRFVLEFAGINARSAEELIDLHTKEVQYAKTLNEVRASRDLPPLPGGDVVLNPVYAQMAQMAAGAAGGGEDDPNAPGADNPGLDGDDIHSPPDEDDGSSATAEGGEDFARSETAGLTRMQASALRASVLEIEVDL